MNCVQRTQWLSLGRLRRFPDLRVEHVLEPRSYVWGAFIHGSLDHSYNGMSTPADAAFSNVRAEPLREQMNAALAGFGACYPPDVTVTTTPAAPPAGQDGWFNAADLAANGGGITVNVSATDDSGVTEPRLHGRRQPGHRAEPERLEPADGLVPADDGRHPRHRVRGDRRDDARQHGRVGRRGQHRDGEDRRDRPDGHLPGAASRVRPERPRRPRLGDRDRCAFRRRRLARQRAGDRDLGRSEDDRPDRRGQGGQHDHRVVRLHRRLQVPRLRRAASGGAPQGRLDDPA